jgi:2-methylcitrate dehydratase PrpD
MAEHAGGNNEHTRKIAEFVSGLTYDAIPAEVRERIKLLILDSLGCAIYGADLEWCRILQSSLEAVDATRTTSVWGTKLRLSSPHAALANGTQVQGFELDDVHRQGVLHVGAVTLPPLIAVAESHAELSGKDFLTAAVAGYEIGPRVGRCMGQEHIGQGWHSGATLGVYSAAAGAARGLALTPDQTVHALGIAGTQSAGLMAAQYGAMVKRMHAGRSAQSGLYGALLARNGFTGIVDVFEAPYGGFCTTFSRSQDRFNLAELSSGLGERFETMGIALKFYSCVGSNHTTLDAIRDIQKRRPFTLAEVDKVVVHGSQVTVDHVGWPYRPEGLTSAQLNLPFCVATLLIEGDVFVDQFTPAAVEDQERIALSRKIAVVHDPAITALGSAYRHEVRLDVHFRDGSLESETREAPRGSERSFATADEIVDKFRKLTRHAMSATRQAALIDAVLALDDLPDSRRLAELLAAE